MTIGNSFNDYFYYFKEGLSVENDKKLKQAVKETAIFALKPLNQTQRKNFFAIVNGQLPEDSPEANHVIETLKKSQRVGKNGWYVNLERHEAVRKGGIHISFARALKNLFKERISSKDLLKTVKNKEFVKPQEAVQPSQIKEALIAKTANFCFDLGNVERALKITREITNDTKTKDSLFVKIASHYSSRDTNKALKIVKEISDTKIKESLIAKIANHNFIQLRKKEALAINRKITEDIETKEAFIAKVARAYCKEYPAKALKIINEISQDTQIKEAVIAEIASSYLDLGNWEKALETAQTIKYDKTGKEALMEKIDSARKKAIDLDKTLKNIKL